MHTVYVGMGGNIASPVGTPEATLAEALAWLGELGRVMRRSSLYSTDPVGYFDQPRFVNAVIELETELAPQELLSGLLRIEKAFGRDRSSGIQNGPRTLDLDLLLYDTVVLEEVGLRLPHPRIGERAFVLVPLNEIAPEARDSRSGATVQQLLQRLRRGSPDVSDAVVPVESEIWRAWSGAGSRTGVRADAPDANG